MPIDIDAASDWILREILTDNGSTFFPITFSLSLFSSSFGLAKCLKTGVAGTFQHGGVLDGLCSVQFLLAFLGKGGFLINFDILINVLSGTYKATGNVNGNDKKRSLFYLLLASGLCLVSKGFLVRYMTDILEVMNQTNCLKH